MTDNFRNRIVGSGTANPKEIKANPMNWRKHPELQRKAMQDVLDNVGWIQDVIINKTTGRLIDGHLRVETALKNGETEIPVKYVELTEDEEKTALATFDPISAMAERDEEQLKKLIEQIDNEDVNVEGILNNTENESESCATSENPYTLTINIPQYEITGDSPELSELVDKTKTIELSQKIAQSEIPTEIKDFLYCAAQRHLVFNYRNIAEYYAHADKDVQKLFEDSALVIIDVNDAMANGYCKLSNEIKTMIDVE